MNVLAIKCLRSLVGVSRMNRVRNEEVFRSVGIERELVGRVDQSVLRWFGHVERMDGYRMARKVFMAEVRKPEGCSRPRLGWMSDMKVALGSRGMTVEAALQCTFKRAQLLISRRRCLVCGLRGVCE